MEKANVPNLAPWTAIDPATISQPEMYRYLVSSVIPRPIAWVSSISAAGAVNLAPFSFFNAVASNPPCLMISLSRKSDGDKKDTLRNIEETQSFVVNIVSEWLLEPMAATAAAHPYGIDEMQIAGLSVEPSHRIAAPRVKESAIQFECETYKTVEIGDGGEGSTSVVFGKIVLMHVSNTVLREGRIDAALLKPLGRLAGIGYSTLGALLHQTVPKI